MASVIFGPFRLDLETGELLRSGVVVKLQPQPARLLAVLIGRGDNYEININADPLMDPLRNEPRFKALCRRVMLGTQSVRIGLPRPSASLARP